MAGAGYKLFNTGDVLTAAQVNTYLMEQTVMVFADAAVRTAALSGVVSEGMISYLKDTNAVEVYNGSAWVASDDPNAIQNTIVDAKGDLITATAADTPARLAVGNNGETLVADSSASTGLKWVGSWTTWTPTIANFVKGNGTETARYVKIGTIVHLYYSFTFGSTSSISGRPEISLPVNQSQSNIIAPVRILDSGTAVYYGLATLAGNTAYIELQNTAGTYSIQAFPSATAPMTWATGDNFTFQAAYEVAA